MTQAPGSAIGQSGLQVQDALVMVITQHGADIINDRPRFNGLIRDYMHPDQRLPLQLLVLALQIDIPQQLAASAANGLPSLVERSVRLLHTKHGLDVEYSRWSVETWRAALKGQAVRPLPLKATQAPPTAKPPPPTGQVASSFPAGGVTPLILPTTAPAPSPSLAAGVTPLIPHTTPPLSTFQQQAPRDRRWRVIIVIAVVLLALFFGYQYFFAESVPAPVANMAPPIEYRKAVSDVYSSLSDLEQQCLKRSNLQDAQLQLKGMGGSGDAMYKQIEAKILAMESSISDTIDISIHIINGTNNWDADSIQSALNEELSTRNNSIYVHLVRAIFDSKLRPSGSNGPETIRETLEQFCKEKGTR